MKKLISLAALFILSAYQNQIYANNETQALKLIVPENNKEIDPENWQLPELTQKQKEEVVYATQTIFNDFYVHRAQKKYEYGFDAQAESNKLSADMSSEDLLKKVNYIFTSIKDYHTYFEYPTPARCVVGGFPLKAKLAYKLDKNGIIQEKLVIAKKLTQTIQSKHATSDDQKSFAALKEGDEILAISNLGIENAPTGTLSVQEAIHELQKVTMGANEDASKLRGVLAFFSRNGGFMKPPSGRFQLTVKHSKKRHKKQKVQTYEFPWVSVKASHPFCAGEQQSHTLTAKSYAYKSHASKLSAHFEQTFDEAYANVTTNENIEKRIVEFHDKKFAIVRINAFVPANVTLNSVHYLTARKHIIQEVSDLREFLIKHRDEIEGLIFDTRDGRGGYGVFPQLITNALTTEYVSNFVVQPLVSQMNRDTFHNLEFSRYYTRLNTQDPLVDKNNNILTEPISETANAMDYYLNFPISQNQEIMLNPAERFDEDENDELPPEYTPAFKLADTEEGTPGKYVIKEIFTNKPVALVTNAVCYSSCDIFASILKDYKIAKIFGETQHTGGGGANVVEWNEFSKPRILDGDSTEGPVIPNGKVLPENMRMRFAWNRIVRKRADDQAVERYIEGVGILVPQKNILKPTFRDVVNNGADAFETIMADMIENRETYPLDR